jgi:hypothetical protein
LSPAPDELLRLAGELRAYADRLERLAVGADAPRPPTPTRAWCLLPGGLVRWAGPPVRLRAGLRALLGALLDAGADRGRPVPYAALDHADVNESRLPKALSELNAALSLVGWPHDYHAADAHVFAD